MAAKTDRPRLSTLTHKQTAECFVMLVERERKLTKSNLPFYDCKVRDRDKVVAVKVWNNSPLFEVCDREWQIGQHLLVNAEFQSDPKWGPQLNIFEARPVDPARDRADGYDVGLLEAASRFDPDAMFRELLGLADSIKAAPLRTLVNLLLDEHEDAIKGHAAAANNHHAYRGGYLEHTLSVTRLGEHLADKYIAAYPELDPPLDKDLILAGCILHDLGKVHELAMGPEGASYTLVGQLIGHIPIGRDMVRDAAREVPDLPADKLVMLEHIILSHQGTAEWGSPKPPLFPEALIVHHADDTDAKVNMFVTILQRSESEQPFTDASNALKRRLYKRRGD